MERDDTVAIPELLLGALTFYRAPQRFARLRDPRQPLPAGVTELLAAGAQALAPAHVADTAARLGSSAQELHDAQLFFIRQALLEAGGDHYRTLGVARDADAGLIRQHYHYLIRLFHPDRDLQHEGWDTVYAPAVNEAWNVLRNPQKRAAYDAALDARRGETPARQAVPRAEHATAARSRHAQRSHRRAPRRLPRAGWLGLAALAMVLVVAGLLLARERGQPVLRVTAANGETAPAQERPKPSREPGANADTARPDTRPNSANAANSASAASARAAQTARAAAGASMEDRVRARVQQATIAVLGPGRAHAMPRSPARADAAAAAGSAAVTGSATSTTAELVPEAQFEVQPLDEPVAPVAASQRASAEALAAVAPIEPAPQQQALAAAPPSPQQQARATAKPAPLPALERAQLDALMRELAASYEAGDARRFAAQFSEDAQTTDASGRAAIRALYHEFFARPESRRMRVQRLRWQDDGPWRSRGTGRAELATTPFDGSAESSGELRLSIVVEQTPQGPWITGLHYQ